MPSTTAEAPRSLGNRVPRKDPWIFSPYRRDNMSQFDNRLPRCLVRQRETAALFFAMSSDVRAVGTVRVWLRNDAGWHMGYPAKTEGVPIRRKRLPRTEPQVTSGCGGRCISVLRRSSAIPFPVDFSPSDAAAPPGPQKEWRCIRPPDDWPSLALLAAALLFPSCDRGLHDDV